MHPRRLDSWKEIGAYLERSVRTVQRWEHDEALPVHRHRHQEASTVYAFAGELDDWLRRRSHRAQGGGSSSGRPARSQGLGASQAFTADLEAERLCAKARRLWEERTPEALTEALELFREARKRDRSCLSASIGTADALAMQGFHGHRLPRRAFDEAEQALAEAFALDGTLTRVMATRGFLQLVRDRDWRRGEETFESVLQAGDSAPEALCWASMSSILSGRPFEAVVRLRQAQELDPGSALVQVYVGSAYYFGRQFEQAERKLRQALDLRPGFPPARLWLARTLTQAGRGEEAVEVLLDPALRTGPAGGFPSLESRGPATAEFQVALGQALMADGRFEEFRQVLTELQARAEQVPTAGYVSPGHLGLLHLALGDVEAAAQHLETAINEAFSSLLFLKLDPALDALREHPHYPGLLRGLNLD